MFEHGLETYNTDPNVPKDQKAGNLGGAKAYWYTNWKSPDGPIHFNNEAFGNVLRELQVALYTLNRIQTKDGKLVRLPEQRGTGFQRTNHCLMAYCQLNEDPNCGRNARARIIEAVKKATGHDLSNYVQVVSDIKNPKASENVSKLVTLDFLGQPEQLKPHAAVLMILPSGSVGSAQFWALKPRQKSRLDLALGSTASASETGDLPF